MRYALLLMLLLASCGGDGVSSSSPSSTNDTTTTNNTGTTTNTTTNTNTTTTNNNTTNNTTNTTDNTTTNTTTQSGHGEDLTYTTNGHPLKCWDTRAEITGPEDEVVKLVNEYRVSKGLNALTHDEGLRTCIRAHCHHMNVHAFFSHTNPEGDDPWKRASKCGVSADGENLALGYKTASSVVSGWKASPGHNANMLGSHTKIGVGFWFSTSATSYNYCWGQLFK